MLNLQQSESFTNDAATTSGRFYSDGRPATGRSASASGLSIAYDATSRSYTVTTAGRSGTFAPADLDQAQSSGAIAVYQKKSGAMTESLALTRPGTSGRFTYQYVGGGYWQRALDNGDTVDFTYDAFTYGVVTPNAALPRTGTGVYAIDLLGAILDGIPVALTGEGVLQADFANGQITTSGSLQKISIETNQPIGSPTAFNGNATLSSSANAFGGSFGFDDFGRFSGNMQGRFYGPSAQEVGASWFARNSDGRVAVGTITGRNDPNAPGFNQTLVNLRASQSFTIPYAHVGYNRTADGKIGAYPANGRGTTTFAYDASTSRYTYNYAGATTSFGPEQKVSGQSDARFTVYELPGTGTDATTRLTLYNPGAGNSELALTYVSFGRWQKITAPSTSGPGGTIGSTGNTENYFAWGLRTDANSLPRTGAGHFEGVVYGTAASNNVGAPLYALSGTSVFDVDFARLNFTGSLSLLGRDASTGTSRDFGTFTFDRGFVSPGAALTADIKNSANLGVGFFDGSLFGPGAVELGGSFIMNLPASGSDAGVTIGGVTVAKRKP